MSLPHEVMILTVEEVLMDIYEGTLSGIDTDAATKAFAEWIKEHNAHYYSNPKISGADIFVNAALDAIKKGKQIVVVHAPSNLPPLSE